MDLYHHSSPPFTNWVLSNGFLREKFVVVDVGCQGGEHPRWRLLGENVEVYGFDPLREIIVELSQAAVPGRHYFATALGEVDGDASFYVPNNTFESSFFEAGSADTSQAEGIQRGKRTVPVRRLDTLFAERTLPIADYIKLDCEGFEPFILRGARKYLAASGPICVTCESSFGLSATFTLSHFHAVNEILAEHYLKVFDLNIVRAPRSPYVRALDEHPWPEPDPLAEAPHLDVGAPGTLDVVFCRDFVAEGTDPRAYSSAGSSPPRPSVDRLIKAMINFELHGLMDCAFDIAVHFREQLKERLDVEKSIELLLRRAPHARNTADVTNCLRMVARLRTLALALTTAQRDLEQKQRHLEALYASRSWKLTAPFRQLSKWLRH